MSGIMIAMIGILLAVCYPIIFSSFKVNKQALPFTLLYAVMLTTLTALLFILNREHLSKGEQLVVPIALLAALARISMSYHGKVKAAKS